MAAVARPRWDAEKNCTFDGKLGIWPFVTEEEAKRSSKNRPKGTLETKCIDSVDNEEIRKILIEKLYPAIREHWPIESRKDIIIVQQDNAKPHVSSSDKKMVKQGLKGGWKIKLSEQPPNSPDFNVLDLGFFNAIQSLQHQSAPNTVDELIAAVLKAYNDQSPETLDDVFLSYHQAMIDTMKNEGSNRYKLQHMGKDKLRRNGLIPVSLQCPIELMKSSKEFLSNNTA